MLNLKNNGGCWVGILLVLFYAGRALAVEPQRIVVDDDHRQFNTKSKKKILQYELKPGDSVLVDATAYTFTPPEGEIDSEPNAVQLVIDKQRQFNTFWDPESKQVLLNKNTLIGRFGPFDGLKAGDSFVLVIGRQVVDEAKQEGFFQVQWVGMGSVKDSAQAK